MTSTAEKLADSPTTSEGLALTMIKQMNGGGGPKSNNSDSGSSNGEGNQSDNSALVGFFGFDFQDGTLNETGSDDGESGTAPNPSAASRVVSSTLTALETTESQVKGKKNMKVTAAASSSNNSNNTTTILSNAVLSQHQQAAMNATDELKSIAVACAAAKSKEQPTTTSSGNNNTLPFKRKSSWERNTADYTSDNHNYNNDDDDDDDLLDESDRGSTSQHSASMMSSSHDGSHKTGTGHTKKRVTEKKREDRNAREKERSFRISKQISDIRDLLTTGGVVFPKGTKSSVLTEAANYIRALQQHQYRSELDRHQLVQQMQLIGSGVQGPQAAQAIRHVAAQNGVWSLGNFGGVPPKSAMSFYQQQPPQQTQSNTDIAGQEGMAATDVDPSDYRFVFNSCGFGMAIASMGGALIDCNQLFCDLSNYSKQELCSLTIFNLTAREDLQHAFDLISQLISPAAIQRGQLHEPKPILLRGAMKNRNDLGICMSMVKGEDGVAKCFCVTLIKNPVSPFDTSTPMPASFESIQQHHQQQHMGMDKHDSAMSLRPTFTSG